MLLTNNPLVSILIPIYGVEKYIERCVVSLMEQSYDNIEYVFVNDCTKDSSIEILKSVIARYPDRVDQVKIITHEINRGLAAARNTALDASTGEYLWHVDSDDWVVNDAVEKLVNVIKQKNSDVVIFGNYNVKNTGVVVAKINYSDRESYISSILLHTIPGSVWNKFFKANFYKKSGVRSIDGLNHGEDYVIIPRLLHMAESIDVLDEPLYYYNLTNQNSYTKNISPKSIGNIRQAYEVNQDYFKNVLNKETYKDVMGLLPFRSMLSLVKTAAKENYKEIIKLYPECFVDNAVRLSIIDRVILFLLRYKAYTLLSIMIRSYRYLGC